MTMENKTISKLAALRCWLSRLVRWVSPNINVGVPSSTQIAPPRKTLEGNIKWGGCKPIPDTPKPTIKPVSQKSNEKMDDGERNADNFNSTKD